ncbi:MAG: hypothetical protein ACRDJ9_28280 [Dehalococcoidia bacterium]
MGEDVAVGEAGPFAVRGRIAATIVLTIALLAAQALAMSALTLGPVAEHAVGHAAMAAPILLLLLLAATVWPSPPPTRLGSGARLVLLGGLAALGGGGLLEGLGALGYAEPTPRATLQAIHDIGVLVTIAGLPLTFAGGLLSIAAAALWRGWLRSTWFWVTTAGVATLVALYLGGALVFGLY